MGNNKLSLPKELAYDRGSKGKTGMKGVKSSSRLRREKATRFTGNGKNGNGAGPGWALKIKGK
jgi:hypothetical protein